MKKSDLFFNILRLPMDFGMISAAGIITYVLRTRIFDAFRPALFRLDLSLSRYLILVMLTAAVFIAVFAVLGLYSIQKRISVLSEFFRILTGASAGILSVIIFIFLRQELFNSRFLVLGGWFFAVVLVTAGRLGVRRLQHYSVSRYSFGVQKVMVIGDDEVTDIITGHLQQDPASGYLLVKRLKDPELKEVLDAVGNPGIDEVILANPNYPADKILQLVDFCHERHIKFKFVPNIYQTLTTHYNVDAIGRIPVVELRRTALDEWGSVAKRTIDIAVGLFATLILTPLFLVISFAVKWETAGPVFVRLRRVSRGREFNLYKFRSMIENAEELKPYLAQFNERRDGPLFKIKDDPRVTTVGRFLRRYRLDELPQFWNILRGDISLVGPRPHQPDEIARYAKRHRRVMDIKSGATGLAQISGSSDLPFEEEISLDTFYIENWTLAMDMRIIFRTILKMFVDRSAV